MLISPEYQAVNRYMLAHKNYGISGHVWAPKVHELAQGIEARSLLDYGCGQGSLAAALPAERRYAVNEYDPGIPGKDHAPANADLVSCTDVLEHIEPDCLNAVLDHLFQLADKAVALVVATIPATKHLPDGQNAHLIVEPVDWWLPKLLSRWQLRAFTDHGPCFFYFGTPRWKAVQ